MTQYRLLLATLLAAFTLAACGKQEAEVTEPAAAEPAPTAEPAAPSAEQEAPPAMEQMAPAAEDPKAAPPANN